MEDTKLTETEKAELRELVKKDLENLDKSLNIDFSEDLKEIFREIKRSKIRIYKKLLANSTNKTGKRNDKFKRSVVRTEDINKIIELLEGAFLWSETEEGNDFWEDIRDRLYIIKEENKVKWVCIWILPH